MKKRPSFHSFLAGFSAITFIGSYSPSLAQENNFNFSQWNLNIRTQANMGNIQIDTLQKSPTIQFKNDSLPFNAQLMIVRKSLGENISLQDRALKSKSVWSGEILKPEFNNLKSAQIEDQNFSTWEVGGSTSQGKLFSCGFVFQSDKYYYDFRLSSRNPTLYQNDIQKACQSFIQNISLVEKNTSKTPKTLQTQVFEQLEIPAFGIQIKNNGTWQQYLNPSVPDQYDFAFYQPTTKAVAWTSSAWMGDEFVEAGTLVDAILTRWGIDPTAATTQVSSEMRAGNLNIWRIQSPASNSKCLNARIFFDGKRVNSTAMISEQKCKESLNNATDFFKGFSFKSEYNRQFTLSQNQFSAKLLNQLGMIQLVHDQDLVALSYFDKANKLDPSDPIYLLNCGFVYQLKEMNAPGIQHFNAQEKLVKEHGKLSWVLGEMYESERNFEKAYWWYTQALQFYPDDEELVINLSDALWGMGQRYASLQVVHKLFKEHPSVRLGVYTAKTMMGLEQYPEATELLFQLKKTNKTHKTLGLALAQALQFQERYGEALTVLGEIKNNAKDSAQFWNLLGVSQYYTQDFKAAVQSMKVSLKKDPDQEYLKILLSAAQAFSGEKNNKALNNIITPVVNLNNWESYLDSNAKAIAQKNNAPALQHLYQESVFWQEKQPWRKSETQVIEILTEGGVQYFSDMTWPFIAGWDKLGVNFAKVYDKNHKLKYSGQLKDYYVTTENAGEGFSGTERAHVSFNHLSVGDIIVVQVSRMSNAKNPLFPFHHFRASRNIPSAQSQFILLADNHKIQTDVYGQLSAKNIIGGIQWTEKNPIVLNKESLMPHYRDIGSGVMVSAKGQWSNIGKDYLKFIQHTFKNSIPVKEKAVELRGQLYKTQDIVDNIATWIRKNIRYKHIPFGGHSIIPQPSLHTLKHFEGDCKDVSLLFKEMLATFNIPAEMVLVNLEEPVVDSLPSIHQFNHMMIHIPSGKDRREQWIDLTEKTSTERLLPYHLEGRYALVLDSAQSKLVRLPTLDNSNNHRIEVSQKIYSNPKGQLDFRDSITLDGKFAAGFREKLLELSQNDQREFIEGWLAQGGHPAKLIDLKLPNLEDHDKPLVIQTIYNTNLVFKNGTSDLHIESPWMNALMRLPQVQNRNFPIRLASAVHLKLKTEFNLGSNKIQLETPEKLNSDLHFVHFKGQKPFISDKKVVLENEWSLDPLYLDPSEYPDLQKEWTQALHQTYLIGQLEKGSQD